MKMQQNKTQHVFVDVAAAAAVGQCGSLCGGRRFGYLPKTEVQLQCQRVREKVGEREGNPL